MSGSPGERITAALGDFASATRLYAFVMEGGAEELMVEAFGATDAVQAIGACDVILLSANPHIRLESVLGKPGELLVSLADGTRTAFAGDISEAAMLGSDGGLTRYRVRLSPWMWRLSQARNSRVWQDKAIIDIVDSVFAAYQPLAKWRWSDDVAPFMNEVRPRSYCCQYRESDLEFVRRLLTEEGLAWRSSKPTTARAP